MIPGQGKHRPHTPADNRTKLLQELWRFGMQPGESPLQAAARFMKTTGKKIPEDVIEMLKKEHEANSAQLERAEKLSEVVKSATNLESFFHPYVELSSKWGGIRDVRDLQVIFSSWINQKFDQAGRKRYEVSLGLAERLAFTELRGIAAKDIRLPFPAILIEIPASMAFGIEALEIQKVILIQEEAPGGIAAQSGITRVWNLTMIPAQLEGMLQAEDRIILGRLFFWEEDKWTESVDKSINSVYSLSSAVKPEEQAMMFASLGDSKIQRSLFNLVANLVLYSTNHNAREVPTNKEYIELGERIQKTPASAKKERLKERRRSLAPNYKIVLGTGVRRIPEEAREGNKIGVRTLVSGFWRNQVYGPAKKDGEWIPAAERLHQMKWVEPFWRGLELGEEAPVTNPTRVMKDPKECNQTTEKTPA